MKPLAASLIALVLGYVLGVVSVGASRDLVVASAWAQQGVAGAAPVPAPAVPTLRPVFEYKVVGASVGVPGYQQDLTRLGAEGWRFAGALPSPSGNPAMVLERQR